MNNQNTSTKNIAMLLVVMMLLAAGCAGGSFTTREKGAGIGALGGAATGGLIGAAVGHPGAGAAIGGASGSAPVHWSVTSSRDKNTKTTGNGIKSTVISLRSSGSVKRRSA